MAHTKLKNIVFDIGNVIVRWDPALIAKRTFESERATAQFTESIFKHEIWLRLNKGHLTEKEAKLAFQNNLGLSFEDTDRLFFHVKDTQDLIEGTVDLMAALSKDGFKVYALSDNVHEIVSYLKERYDFWPLFDAAIISAEIGMVKPYLDIFEYLLKSQSILADETLFFDDMLHNIEGAKRAGLSAYQFTTVAQAKADLVLHGVSVTS